MVTYPPALKNRLLNFLYQMLDVAFHPISMQIEFELVFCMWYSNMFKLEYVRVIV